MAHHDNHSSAATPGHASHGHAADGHHREGYDFAHPLPLPMLFGVFGVLVLLTIVTVFQANFDLGTFDIYVVMGIATIKAILVALFFMHLAYDKPFNLIVFISSFVFVGLFVIFTLSDSRMTSGDFDPTVDEVITVSPAAQ